MYTPQIEGGHHSPRPRTTVTISSPGLIVSAVSRVASPVTVTVIVTLCPAAREPEVCDRLTLPRTPDGTEMDQFTGPPFAVIVNELLPAVASVIVDVDTDSVPSLALEDDPPEEEEPLAVGDGDAEGDPEDEEPDDPEEPEEEPADEEDELVVVPPPEDLVPDATVTDEVPFPGSDDGFASGDWRPWADFVPGRTLWVPLVITLVDEAASGITAESEDADAAPLPLAGAWCAVAANPVAVAATATVPTAATASRGAVSSPSRPVSALGKPSSPNEMRRPPMTRRQDASGPRSVVIR